MSIDLTSNPAIVWFRRDLRLSDHGALTKALTSHERIIALFILDEANEVPNCLGSAARYWLHHSLSSLSEALNAAGGQLILRRGDSLGNLLAIAKQSGARNIYVSKSYSPSLDRLDEELGDILGQHDITLESCEGHLLHEPESIRSLSGQPYRVFTPFWKAMLKGDPPHSPLPAPKQLSSPVTDLASDTLSDWQLLPISPNWAGEFADASEIGEPAALARLHDFTQGPITSYSEDRDYPALDEATSRLSPHLAFGELSPATIWHSAQHAKGSPSQALAFQRQLAWRDFCYSLLISEPELATRNWNKAFDPFEWQVDEEGLVAWKRGMTGYPIVDAGMRQLWRHGTMHNRVRMICASFLIKHLLIDWRQGEQYFADTLLDMDVANNPANWQWVAGSGADASPFFRIFNPILQGEKFDKQGTYIRRFVPELKDLPSKYIHRPFEAPEHILEKAGVALGKTYPSPIIDHAFARQRALDSYAALKAEI